MAQSVRMYCGLLAVVVVMAVNGFPSPADMVESGMHNNGARRAYRNGYHLKHQSTHHDKVLAIGTPLVMSKYKDYAPASDQSEELADKFKEIEFVPTQDQNRRRKAQFVSHVGRFADRDTAGISPHFFILANNWYRKLIKCPDGEVQDAMGICRQLWDGTMDD